MTIDENTKNAEAHFGSAECGFGACGSGPQFEHWKTLSHYILEWFLEPDLDALRIAYSAICAHYAVPDKPGWFFLLGDSGTGKTALAIDPCKKIPRAQALSHVTANSFISGYTQNGKASTGILQRGNDSKSMIWLFQDFTSVISMPYDRLVELAKVLRECWDGSTQKETGNVGKIYWQGRVTTLAAGTPAVERYWQRFRHLGDRFTTVRWKAPNDRADAVRWVFRQSPHRDKISSTLQERVYKFMDPTWLNSFAKTKSFVSLPPEFESLLADSIDFVARLQTSVERDQRNHIRYVSSPEFPSRLAMAIQFVIKGHMALMGRTIPGAPELRIAKKILLDSIPQHRRAILDALPLTDGIINRHNLALKSKVPKASLYLEVEELSELGILDVSDAKLEPAVSWSRDFLDLSQKAAFILKV